MKTQTISIVAAMDTKRGIGFQNKIPWHIREDLIRFKTLTMGHVTIMGRKTYESLISYYERSGKPMPERNDIMVTRDVSYKRSHCIIVHSLEEAIKKGKEVEQTEIFIAGGGQMFERGLQYAQKLYLTLVEGIYKADTFFPDYSSFTKTISRETKNSQGYTYTFLTLER